MSKVIVGVFKDSSTASRAIEQLRNAGFAPGQISILAPNESARTEPWLDTAASNLEHVMTPADATSPADKTVTSYTAVGAVAGGLVGLAAAILPNVGGMLGAGPLLAAITGAAAGSYVGTLTGALVHFDVPEQAARVYETNVSSGNVLIAVHTEDTDERSKAEDILDQAGAIEIDTKAA